MSTETDEALYALAARGDTGAFDRLYARYEHALFGFVLRQVRDRAEAEEIFHDTFLKVLEATNVRFDGAPRFAAWLFRVARNACANHRRGRTRSLAALSRLGEKSEEAIATPEQHGAFRTSRSCRTTT